MHALPPPERDHRARVGRGVGSGRAAVAHATAAALPPLNLRKPPNNIILVRDVDDEPVQHVFTLLTVAERALLTLSWPSGHVVLAIHLDQFVAPVPIISNFIRALHRFQHIYAQLAVLKEASKVNRQISSRPKIQEKFRAIAGIFTKFLALL